MSQVLKFPDVQSDDVHFGEPHPLDHFIVRDGKRYAGTHLTIDLYGAERLTDKAHMEEAFAKCVEACGATLLHMHVHTFLPSGGLSGVAVLAESHISVHTFLPSGGLSGVAVLAESHISVHTWPEANYAAFDVFMCGDAEPEKAVPILKEAFGATTVSVQTHLRGSEIEQHVGDGA